MILAKAYGISPREVYLLTGHERAVMWQILDEIHQAEETNRG